MRVNLQHKTNILKFIRMKNLFTIIAASLLLGTASMAAADPDFVIVSAEHTGIDNNPAYLDLRPNDTTRHLYIWENTATGETLTDTPYEGGEYLRLHVASGWFGLGFVSDDAVDMSVFSRKNMVLHFAVRTKSTCPLFVKLEGGTYPGSARVDLKGIYDVARDGEWHAVEIPVSAFQAAGLVWAGNVSGKNYFSLVSEGSTPGDVIDLDYVYFHSGTRDDGTQWEGLNLGAVSPERPTAYLIASEHTDIDGNPAYVDLRPDNATRHLYVWENTAEAYENNDLVAYEGSQYSCLHITNPAWWGFGVISDAAVDMSAIAQQPYYLRFAIATTSLMPLFVKLEGNNGTSAVCYLQGKYQFRRDGEWHLIQIPMTDFLYQGLDWSTPIAGKNYFALVSEQSQADYLLSFDAITIEAGEPQSVDEPRPDVDKSKLADYVLIAAEDGVVPAGKNVLDLRPNGSDINLYVWENTAAENPTVDGEAFEGAQYSSLLVQNSWFGFGVMNSSPKDFTCFQYKDFRFHVAMRTTSQMPLELRFEGLGSAVVKLDETMLPRDGKWHEIEFPYSDLAAQGLVWDGEQMGKNFMSLVSEQSENGAVLDFDAIYFYSTGDKEDSVAQLPAATTLTFDGTTLRTTAASRIVVCNVMGQMVANTEATEVSTAGWQPGLYIARQGNAVVKFVVK